MVTSIILIRHASCEKTTPDERNRQDHPLSKLGQEQAKKTALFLKGATFSKAYSSNMVCAKETAHLITNQEIEQQENLAEFNNPIVLPFISPAKKEITKGMVAATIPV